MKRIGMVVALLAGALLASQALAQQPGQSYFGASYGSVWTDGAFPNTGLTQDDDTSGGGKIFAGSMLWDNWGMEVGYYDLGKYDARLMGAKISEAKTSAIAVSGVYATDIGAGFNFNAKFGIAFTQHDLDCPTACVVASSRKRGTSGMLGLGIGAKLGQGVQVRVDFEHFGSVHQAVGAVEYKDAYDMFSVGIQFNF